MLYPHIHDVAGACTACEMYVKSVLRVFMTLHACAHVSVCVVARAHVRVHVCACVCMCVPACACVRVQRVLLPLPVRHVKVCEAARVQRVRVHMVRAARANSIYVNVFAFSSRFIERFMLPYC